MFSTVTRLPQCQHPRLSVNLYITRLLGDVNTSYIKATADLSLIGFAFHISVHESSLLNIFSNAATFPGRLFLVFLLCACAQFTPFLLWLFLAPLHCAWMIHHQPSIPLVTVPKGFSIIQPFKHVLPSINVSSFGIVGHLIICHPCYSGWSSCGKLLRLYNPQLWMQWVIAKQLHGCTMR